MCPVTLTPDLPRSATFPAPADVLLADGSVAVIRPLEPGDRAAVEALHDDLSEDSLRSRFFASGRRVAHQYVEHLFSDDGPAVCLVGLAKQRIVAIGAAERLEVDAAEVGFVVSDALHGHGLGSLLLEHLAAACHDLGIRRFHAEVLAENVPMQGVFAHAGFELSRRSETGVLVLEMSTTATARAVAASDARERASQARSLAPLTSPASVVVVGVRRDGTGIGSAVLDSIRTGGFTGRLAVVHPHESDVGGVAAHRRLVDVPDHVDLVVVAVPAAETLAVMRDAAAAGVSAVVILSTGFDEAGADGERLQSEVVRLAREHSIRLVGPNCLGVLVNDPGVRLNATFTRGVPPPGGLAIASQSGGVGIAVLDAAARSGLGVQSFVSLGNSADVSSHDLLAAWLDDSRVTAAALYLESFGNPRRFARLARSFSERKPLLAVVGGRSAGGQRAGASHTAAAASPAVGVRALFDQAGVISCDSAETMAHAALLLAGHPRPQGSRLGIVTNAGGLGVLAADAATDHGLLVPQLSPDLRRRLRGHTAGPTGVSNPVDLGAAGTAPDLEAALLDLADCGEVDAVAVVLVGTSVTPADPTLRAVVDAGAQRPDLPIVLVPMGGLVPEAETAAAPPVLPSIEAAMAALARVVAYTAWLRAPRRAPAPPEETRAAEARATARRLARDRPGTTAWLGPEQCAELTSAYDVAPAGRVVHGPIEATLAARDLGYPVAVKAADPHVLHKTERGLVHTDLVGPGQVADAVNRLREALGDPRSPIMVQPMYRGIELALGIVRHHEFGPLVMLAAGGIATNILDDRVFLLPPVAARDAVRAVRRLRIWPLLSGYRGAEPVDVGALERLLMSVAHLAEDVPEIAELDLNPVLVSARGAHLVDVKVRLAPTSWDPGLTRQLGARS